MELVFLNTIQINPLWHFTNSVNNKSFLTHTLFLPRLLGSKKIFSKFSQSRMLRSKGNWCGIKVFFYKKTFKLECPSYVVIEDCLEKTMQCQYDLIVK